MVRLEQPLLFLAVALGTVSASPLPDATPNPGTPVTGTNTGSIYSLDPETTSRPVLWNSGSCGLSTYFPNVDPTAELVAMPGSVMTLYGASQNNALCGKNVTMTQVGTNTTVVAVVADTNISPQNSIDMLMGAWVTFGRSPTDADTKNFQLDWSIDMSSS
jgi:hypothetical protein